VSDREAAGLRESESETEKKRKREREGTVS
jgi:hypothetical protein